MSGNKIVFKDLTIADDADGGTHDTFRADNSSSWITLDGVKMTHVSAPAGYWLAYFNGPDYVTLKDCTFEQDLPVAFYYDARQIFVTNCTFKGYNDCNTMFQHHDETKEVSIMDCWAGNLGGTRSQSDTSRGRFVHGNNGFKYHYFGDNTTEDLCPRSGGPDDNSGEQWMFEACATLLRETIVSATSNTATFTSTPSSSLLGHVITIQSGKGQGQSRLISNISSQTVTIERPWQVIPTNTSIATLGQYAHRAAVWHNTFDGYSRGIEGTSHIASMGIAPYGGGSEIVAQSNTIQQVRYGIDWRSRHKGGTTDFQPFLFNVFEDNYITNCYYGLSCVANKDTIKGYVWSVPQNLLNVIRKNTIIGTVDNYPAVGYPIRYGGAYQPSDTGEQIDMQIFDQNIISGFPSDVITYTRSDGYEQILSTEVTNQVYRGNTTNGASWNP